MRLLATFLLVLTSGCSGASSHELLLTTPERLGGDIPVRLVNTTRHVACFVYLTENGEEDWGADWLGVTEIVDAEGGIKELGVSAGTYQLKIELCGHRLLAQQWDLDLSGPREIVLHEGPDPGGTPREGFTRVPVQAVDVITLDGDAGAPAEPEGLEGAGSGSWGAEPADATQGAAP